MTNWNAFANINAKALNDQAKTLAKGDFEELPLGRYEVSVESMELKPTKKTGAPMIAVKFKVVEGEFKGRFIFMHQVVLMGNEHDAMRLRIANQFLESLETGLDITFEGVDEYETLVADVFDAIGNREYLLEIGDKKGYRNYKVVEVYEE